jgi:serpin B
MNHKLAALRASVRASLSLSLLTLVACTPVDAPPPGERIPTTVARASSDAVPAADQRALTDAQLSFGWSLRAAALPTDRNAMLSPFSVHTALTMAHVGARGASAEGLAALLRTGSMGDRALDAYNAVERALVARGTGGVVLRTANAVFARRGLGFERSFVDGLAEHFPVGLSALNFATDPEGARTGINGWVSAQTEGRIPTLFAPGSMNADTRLVLVNAMYFNGPWRYAFERSQTQDRRFTLADGAVISVPKMTRTMPVRSARGDGWRAVELPYANESLVMVAIVPDEGSLASFESRLADGQWGRITEALSTVTPSELEVMLPRFSFGHRVDLTATLREGPAAAAFSDGADFSGITRELPMRIERVVHQTFIAAEERGTEAAAATGVVFGPTSYAPPVSFDVDRPFVFVIRDVPTGAPLFVGHVVDPRRQ